MSKATKKYWEMNKTELAKATKEFDQEFIADKARPMTPTERKEERRARRRGRPRVGKGAQKIHITLERGLVKQADKLARQNGWGRSELIARALAAAIGRKGGLTPSNQPNIGVHSTIFTVGHSTHPWSEFLKILQAHDIKAIADVRQFPGSRRFPHFNAEALAVELPKASIEYLPFRNLGGRRKAREDSPNTAWRHAAFRGYADYMQTPAFAAGMDQLVAAAAIRPTAIMCSEAVPWRCHRSLIGDALLVRGWTVLDIFDQRQIKPHVLTPFAVVSGTEIVYPLKP